MKAKYIFAASLLVAGAAFADSTDVDTEFVVGVFPLTLQANVAETAIFVPWIESGGTTGVAVSNLVKTAGLVANDGVNVTKGDELLWYDGSKFEAWELTTNSTDGVSYWVSAAQGAAADAQRIARGQSIILRRNNNYASATTVYLVGQYTNASASSSIAGGTKASPTYTLIAPTAVSGTVNLKTKLSGVAAKNDAVTFIDGSTKKLKTYVYNGTNWGTPGFDTTKSPPLPTFTPASDADMTLSAGYGFWYKRCSGADAEEAIVNW